MRKAFTIIELMIVTLIIAFISILIYVAVSEVDKKKDRVDIINKPNELFILKHQITVFINYYDITKWLESNKNSVIHSITSIDRTGHGNTTGFLIVYSTAMPNIPSIEKSN